jgi:hypothetical protein
MKKWILLLLFFTASSYAQLSAISVATTSTSGSGPIITTPASTLSQGTWVLGSHLIVAGFPEFSYLGEFYSLTAFALPIGLSYGILSNLEAGINVPFAAYQYHSDFDSGSEIGLGDIGCYGKFQLIPQLVALGAVVSLPTGDKEKALGSGKVGLSLVGAVNKNFSSVGLYGNVGYSLPGSIVSYNAALTYPFTEKISGSAEVVGIIAPNFVIGIAPGLRFDLTDRLLLDLAALIKLYSSAEGFYNYQLIVGINYTL